MIKLSVARISFLSFCEAEESKRMSTKISLESFLLIFSKILSSFNSLVFQISDGIIFPEVDFNISSSDSFKREFFMTPASSLMAREFCNLFLS